MSAEPPQDVDEAQQIDLEPFYPTSLDAEETPETRLNAGATVCQPDKGTRPEVLANRGRRQGRCSRARG